MNAMTSAVYTTTARLLAAVALVVVLIVAAEGNCAGNGHQAKDCGAMGKGAPDVCCPGTICLPDSKWCYTVTGGDKDMTVSCINWFKTSNGKHIHTEVAVHDVDTGEPVVGTEVEMRVMLDGSVIDTVFFTTLGRALGRAGHDGDMCAIKSTAGVTDMYCVMSAKTGTYQMQVLGVAAVGYDYVPYLEFSDAYSHVAK